MAEGVVGCGDEEGVEVRVEAEVGREGEGEIGETRCSGRQSTCAGMACSFIALRIRSRK